ncbi:MAG TPA: hypothetical protein VES58_05100, partial [Syntrophobacteria bacterium]|nr:hypothetical protein [Syntrophobacteria bacterium]
FQPPEEVVMRDLASIIRDYREADSEKRLHLFLDCPTLRNEFIEIELHSGTKERKSVSDSTLVKSSVWRRILSYAHLV